MAGRMAFVLPYLESWRKLRPTWLRRFLSSAVYYLPWQSVRKVRGSTVYDFIYLSQACCV